MKSTINNDSKSSGVYESARYGGAQRKKSTWFYSMNHSLNRRAGEVERAFNRYLNYAGGEVLDLGTADGLMIERLLKSFPDLRFYGIDYGFSIMRDSQRNIGYNAWADGQRLPFKTGVFQAVVMAAVIEHVPKPASMLEECRRVLAADGLLVITTPNPFMDKIAEKIGVYNEEITSGHQETFDIKSLKHLCQKCGFEVLETTRFMLFPMSFPGEKLLERLVNALGLGILISNQVVVARRSRND